ncbi:hypothetical protein J31TS3_00290 [Paenibacillus lactis]|nr:hypothetical protein J31TS3_00290 [Paenibacillus lactis]
MIVEAVKGPRRAKECSQDGRRSVREEADLGEDHTCYRRNDTTRRTCGAKVRRQVREEKQEEQGKQEEQE